ncbi:MAG: type II/IV secretion system protein [Phycisphaerales bacterium]|nr:type II/IV secretion system protein [Phycisphaerales bacterium]
MLDSNDILVRALLEEGVVDEAQAQTAQRHASENGMSVPEAIVALAMARSRDLAIARAAICECPFVDVDAYTIDIRNAERLPRSLAEKVGAFPLFTLGDVATVGMLDPLNLRALDQIRQALKTDVDVVLCDADPLRSLIARAYSISGASGSGAGAAGAAPAATTEDALVTGEEPIVAAVNQIIAGAIDDGASDVHINPDEHALRLRYRVDGVLQERQGPPLSAHAGLVQRIKVMAHLDLTQTRRPQDGKFRFERRGGAVDVRVSIIPTVCGENVVLRLLRQSAAIAGFAELGLAPSDAKRLESALGHPHGLILVTGPTGSGKTTTLYTAIARLNTPGRNIITIEDPVEIRMSMIRQVQVNAEIGMTFAGALRSVLRHDPDVVLVGEIRDQETAQIAVQASLTGHLVLSTLHTNDAVGAVARLRDFGVPPFAINASLLAVVAQRLVRRVCDACAAPDAPDPRALERFGVDARSAANWRRGAGCARCAGAGYKGRVGIYEILDVTRPVQSVIERTASPLAIREAALAEGMRPMWRDGVDKAMLGLTTLDEVAKAAASSDAASEPSPAEPMRAAA